MTSSRPLSYGGYDAGATGRPVSIFETAQKAGQTVSAYCTTHWVCRYHGYGNNIDDEHLLFALNTLPGTALALFRSTLALWHRGQVSDDEVVTTARKTIGVFFDHMIDYCQERQRRASENAANYSNERFVADGYDFDKVIALVEKHRELFHQDILEYLHRHMDYVPKAHQWIAREWRYMRTPGTLVRLAWSVAAERIGGLFSKEAATFSRHRQKRYVDGAAVTGQIISTIENWDGRQPFFIWNHYQDTHIPYCAGTGLDWFRKTPDYLQTLGYPRDLDISVAVNLNPSSDEQWQTWSALYDAAVFYADQQIGRIIDALEKRDLLKDTLIVICGDHGEELGEHGDTSHHFRLYSHNVRVPLLFSHPDFRAGSNDALVELTDIAPTIASAMGAAPDADWVGAPVWDDKLKARQEVVVESFFGGNCVFETRPLYMAARDKRWNFMWKEFLDHEDLLSPKSLQLYDHLNDPLEQNNLYADDHPEIPRLSQAIIARLRDIKEISPERIVQAFPNIK